MRTLHSFIDAITKRKTEIYKDGGFTGIRVHKRPEELLNDFKNPKKVLIKKNSIEVKGKNFDMIIGNVRKEPRVKRPEELPKKTVSVKKFWLVVMYALGIMIGFWFRGVI